MRAMLDCAWATALEAALASRALAAHHQQQQQQQQQQQAPAVAPAPSPAAANSSSAASPAAAPAAAAMHATPAVSPHALAKEEYSTVLRKLYLAIRINEGDTTIDAAELTQMVEAEWRADSAADGTMGREAFRNSLFELCDVHTETVHASEYAAWLRQMIQHIFVGATPPELIQSRPETPTALAMSSKAATTQQQQQQAQQQAQEQAQEQAGGARWRSDAELLTRLDASSHRIAAPASSTSLAWESAASVWAHSFCAPELAIAVHPLASDIGRRHAAVSPAAQRPAPPASGGLAGSRGQAATATHQAGSRSSRRMLASTRGGAGAPPDTSLEFRSAAAPGPSMGTATTALDGSPPPCRLSFVLMMLSRLSATATTHAEARTLQHAMGSALAAPQSAITADGDGGCAAAEPPPSTAHPSATAALPGGDGTAPPEAAAAAAGAPSLEALMRTLDQYAELALATGEVDMALLRQVFGSLWSLELARRYASRCVGGDDGLDPRPVLPPPPPPPRKPLNPLEGIEKFLAARRAQLRGAPSTEDLMERLARPGEQMSQALELAARNRASGRMQFTGDWLSRLTPSYSRTMLRSASRLRLEATAGQLLQTLCLTDGVTSSIGVRNNPLVNRSEREESGRRTGGEAPNQGGGSGADGFRISPRLSPALAPSSPRLSAPPPPPLTDTADTPWPGTSRFPARHLRPPVPPPVPTTPRRLPSPPKTPSSRLPLLTTPAPPPPPQTALPHRAPLAHTSAPLAPSGAGLRNSLSLPSLSSVPTNSTVAPGTNLAPISACWAYSADDAAGHPMGLPATPAATWKDVRILGHEKASTQLLHGATASRQASLDRPRGVGEALAGETGEADGAARESGCAEQGVGVDQTTVHFAGGGACACNASGDASCQCATASSAIATALAEDVWPHDGTGMSATPSSGTYHEKSWPAGARFDRSIHRTMYSPSNSLPPKSRASTRDAFPLAWSGARALPKLRRGRADGRSAGRGSSDGEDGASKSSAKTGWSGAGGPVWLRASTSTSYLGSAS